MHIRLIPTFSDASIYSGACTLTGHAQRHTTLDPTSPLEPVVTTGVEIEGRGVIEFSMDTAREIANVIGYIDPSQVRMLEEALISRDGEIYDLEARLQQKADAVSALSSEVAQFPAILESERAIAYGKGYDEAVFDNEILSGQVPAEVPE